MPKKDLIAKYGKAGCPGGKKIRSGGQGQGLGIGGGRGPRGIPIKRKKRLLDYNKKGE